MRVTSDLGRIDVADVPLPTHVEEPSAAYTPSGRVFVLYRTGAHTDDWYECAVVDDDGSSFTTIFAGPVPQHPKANGIRHIMFADNRRVLLGDHVLEASPDLDTCEHVELVPVSYPWSLEDNPLVSHHWSEIIVSPDGEHIAWTTLRTDMGAVASLGRLRRTHDNYVVDDPQLISTLDEFLPDPDHAGCVLPQLLRGGEVKQFVRGGTAISTVGAVDGLLPDSVVQDLCSPELVQVTRTPGYDETTMLSPDERLGLVMTSRASRRTDPAVLGLLPRPHAILTGGALAWVVYTYTVTGVRTFREGNVGPVLVDVHRSQHEPGYQGTPLHDPDEAWVYVSPMSWHPGGRRVMWLETAREQPETGARRRVRVRRAELLDREPGLPVPTVATPDSVPYGVSGAAAEDFLQRLPAQPTVARVAGRHSGYLEHSRRPGDLTTGRAASAESRYVDFTDDGLSVWNGYERVESSFVSDTVYEANLSLSGEPSGEMRLRATWSGMVGPQPARLLFSPAGDGQPKTHGFARYRDTTLRIEDLAE